jgi:formate dehydrogenase subunit delta
MNADKLVQMANQIASFFAAEPQRETALDGVATHLRKFWDPRMRRELLARFDRDGALGMHELVAEAIRAHRQRLEPKDRAAT